ncbi:MAG: thioredoxin TrxC [Campylobacteraceae bacterium]|nr:thioredoxin TrxC [Campylobacteraceae bacterium]
MLIVCPYCFNVNKVPFKESYKKAICGHCKESLLFTNVLDLYAENFDTVVANSSIPVVVDFWAPWCGPCRVMGPEFEKAAKEFPLRALFTKVNTQDEQKLALRFDVRSIPTLIVFKDGEIIYRMSGAMKKEAISTLVKSMLNKQ